MRPVKEVTASEENFRLEPVNRSISVVKRDPVKPEPEGTIILKAFRITGYDQDCDGSLMARLDCIDKEGRDTGWSQSRLGLYSDAEVVVSMDEWQGMFEDNDD